MDQKSPKVYSDCVGSDEKVEWSHNDIQYMIRGTSMRSKDAFLKCLETVKTVISGAIKGGLPSLIDRDIYAISFYDGLATQVRNHLTKFCFKISDFWNSAKEIAF